VAEYDDLSGKVGGLEATTSHILRSVNTIEGMMQSMVEKTILYSAANEASHKRLDSLEPRVEMLEDTEQQRAGAWKTLCILGGSIATIGGLVGGWLAKVLGLV